MRFTLRCSATFFTVALLGACSGSQVGVLEAPINQTAAPSAPLSLLDDETIATLGRDKGILEMHLTTEGESAEVHRYQGDLWKDDVLVGEFNIRATNGEATALFSHLEPGDYALRYSARNLQGATIATSDGNAQASSGPYSVTMNTINRYSACHHSGRMKVLIKVKDGEFGTHVRTPGVAAISRPALEANLTRNQSIAQLSPIDDDGHLTMTLDDLQKTANSRYIAIGMSNDGASSTFLGPVRFAQRSTDPLNPGNPTLSVELLGVTKRFFFNGSNQLTAVADSGRRLPAHLASLVDPEKLPDELYVSAVFPFGTPARNYFYLTANRFVHELVLGAVPGDGLLGATFPDAKLGAIHIQRMPSRDEHRSAPYN